MLHIKLERIKALAIVPEGKAPHFEGIIDSLLDLINYSSMYVAFIEEGYDDKPK